MHARAVILMFGLVSLACTMDNPAFNLERGSGAADESGDGDPSGPEGSSESNDDKHGDGDPSGDGDGEPSGDGDGEPNESSTTDGDCTLGVSCGPCQICDQNGECVPDVGAPCEEAQTHCGEFLYGMEGSSCYRFADVTIDGHCNAQGACEPSPATQCPNQLGETHFECDPACLKDGDGCPKYGNPLDAKLSDMCVVGGLPGPDCKTVCSNESGSALKNYACFEGQCNYLGEQSCGNYACNVQNLSCYPTCQGPLQCAQGFNCNNQQCS